MTRKITNHANLPEPLVRAVANDPYDASSVDYSTTTLIKPPRIVVLEHAFKDEIEEDASDRIWALMGQLGHLVLERAAVGADLSECRFKAERLGKKIGGQLDLWQNNTLLDYKFTSIWTATNGVKPEWEQQMNVNALLCRENSVTVTTAQIVCIYRDWSVGEARRNSDYPQYQVQVFDVKLWAPEKQEAFVLERIRLHEAARTELPECSALDRWEKPAKWALMKAGNKKATRLYDTAAEADQDRVNHGGQYSVEYRPAVQTRCEDYCACSKFCTQFAQLKATT